MAVTNGYLSDTLIHVTSSSSMSYCSNSKYWSHKHAQSGNIHFIILDVYVEWKSTQNFFWGVKRSIHRHLNKQLLTLVSSFHWSSTRLMKNSIFRIEVKEPYPELNGGQNIRRARGPARSQLLRT